MTVQSNSSENPSAAAPHSGESSSPEPQSGMTETQQTDLGNMKQTKTFASSPLKSNRHSAVPTRISDIPTPKNSAVSSVSKVFVQK